MISVIVVSAGEEPWDQLTVPALSGLKEHATKEYELIVVDNGGLSRGTVNISPIVPYGRAVNIGARHAKGERLLILNNDIVVQGPYMERIGAHPLEGPTIRTISFDIKYIEGWAISIDHALWDVLGGFDGNFRNSWEDVDLSWRASLLGFPPQLIADWPMRHFYGETRNRYPHLVQGLFENEQYFHAKKERAKWTWSPA